MMETYQFEFWKSLFDEGKVWKVEGWGSALLSVSVVLEFLPWTRANNPHVTHTFKWGGFSCFVHPRRDAVDETLYNPVSLPCYLFGQKSQKRLQPEGIVFPAALPVSSVFIHKGRASGNGRAFVVHCTSAFWAVARMLCSQTELEAHCGIRSLLREDFNPSLVDSRRLNAWDPNRSIQNC